VVVLSSVIAYLIFTLKNMRKRLYRVEKIATAHDSIRAMSERRED